MSKSANVEERIEINIEINTNIILTYTSGVTGQILLDWKAVSV